MPILDALDFTRNDLAVTYRASDAPQTLSFRIRTQGPIADPELGSMVEDLIGVVEMGGAGSDVFPPEIGAAKLVAGDPGAPGPDLAFDLEIRGAAPVFLRSAIESVRFVGGIDNLIVAMHVSGSLPLVPGAPCAREADVRAWLDDPDAYPRAWPSPGFKVIAGKAMGALIRIRLGVRVDATIEEHLRSVVFHWLYATNTYVSSHAEWMPNEPRHLSRLMPKFARARNEFRVTIEQFTRRPGPARALLVNMLARFHATVAPVGEAEIAL